MLTIDDVRKIYSIRNIVGIDSGRSKIVCPLPMHSHKNNTPSFSVFTGKDGIERFECHGNCGMRGDVVDLIGYTAIAGYDPTVHAVEAMDILTSDYSISRPTKPPPTPELASNMWMKYIPPGDKAIEYAKSRGIDRDTMKHFRIGQNGRYLSMPTFVNDILKMIKFRNMGSGLRFYAERGSTAALFNHDQVASSKDPILIVKGEIPTAVIWQRGIKNVCGLTAGEGMRIDKFTSSLIFSRNKIIIGDNDEDPMKRLRMQSFINRTAQQIKASAMFPPDEFIGVDDWVLSDSNAISTIKEWLR